MIDSYTFVGGWGINERADEHGLFTYQMDETSGALCLKGRSIPNVRMGGMAWHPFQNILYCPNESAAAGMSYREGGGCIYAVRVNPESGETEELGHTPAFGSNPAYVAVDKSGKYLFSANHGNPQAVIRTRRTDNGYVLDVLKDESNLALFRINEQGVPEGPIDIVKLPSEPGRQSMTHCTRLSTFGNLIAVCDIGRGAVYLVGVDEATETIAIRGKYDGDEVKSARYCVFHPTKKLLYVNNENHPKVCTFAYDESGKLELLGVAKAVPDGVEGHLAISDICMTPDAAYVYTLIRGTNSVAVFAVQEDGTLKRIQYMPLHGASAKGCAVTPNGAFLYVAMRVSGEIVAYPIGSDGRLDTYKVFKQENPANFVFARDGKICR